MYTWQVASTTLTLVSLNYIYIHIQQNPQTIETYQKNTFILKGVILMWKIRTINFNNIL